jgi:hypothetical protein
MRLGVVVSGPLRGRGAVSGGWQHRAYDGDHGIRLALVPAQVERRVGGFPAGRRDAEPGRGSRAAGTVAGVPGSVRGADHGNGGASRPTDAPVVPGVPQGQRRVAACGWLRVAAGGDRGRALARRRVRTRGDVRGVPGRGRGARGTAGGGYLAARTPAGCRVRRHLRPDGPRGRGRGRRVGRPHLGELAGRVTPTARELPRVHAEHAPGVPQPAGAPEQRGARVRQRHHARAGRPDGRGPAGGAARRLGTRGQGVGRGEVVRQTARRRTGRPVAPPARTDLHGLLRRTGDGPAVRSRAAATVGRRARGALVPGRLHTAVPPAWRRRRSRGTGLRHA